MSKDSKGKGGGRPLVTANYTYLFTVSPSGSVGTTDASGLNGSFSVTQNDDTYDRSDKLTFGASIEATLPSGKWKYHGSLNIDGKEYPVFRNGNTLYVASSSESIAGTSGGTLTARDTTPVCFVAGTLILTPDGERPIESLQPGDFVVTPNGPRAVRFLARSTRSIPQLRAFGKMPIRIAQGALGHYGPACDTFLSPSHAICIGDYLVEAGALINGTSVEQLTEWPEDFLLTYYNLELESHALITANGMVAESYFANFRSNGFSRDSWDNYDEYVELYGEGTMMEEMDLQRVPFARQMPMELRLLLQLHESANGSLEQDSATALAL